LSLELWILLGVNAVTILFFVYFALFIYPYRELTDETRRRPRSFVSNAVFREYWYFVMEPLKQKFISWGVNPNTITVWGLIFSVAAGVAFGYGRFGLGGWCVILAATCDVYDGLLARALNLEMPSGAYFDSTLDRVGEIAMFLGLLLFFKNETFWFVTIYIMVTASGLVSYCRSRAEGLGFGKAGLRGFFQRAERMIVMSVGMVLAPVVDLFAPPNTLVHITILIVCAGSVQTAISRFLGIYLEIRGTET